MIFSALFREHSLSQADSTIFQVHGTFEQSVAVHINKITAEIRRIANTMATKVFEHLPQNSFTNVHCKKFLLNFVRIVMRLDYRDYNRKILNQRIIENMYI